MEIKDSLTMPKSGFEMRGNLPQKEPNILKIWQDNDLYQLILAKNKDNKPFILHDGPPYANGNIHLGHALNKILKDFIIRYKSMQGYYTPFIPGWDTHGLPIENALQKKGVNRKTISIAEFRTKCAGYANEQVEGQKKEFLRLGVIGDFDKPYLTLRPDYEAAQIRIFAKLALQGFIYKGLKPVYWSPSSESALAEAEIEYHDVTSDSIYVAFKVKDGKGILRGDESVIIWTTTPWTLPANLAISLNPDYEYGVYETNKGVLIFLNEFLPTLTQVLNLENVKLRHIYKGKELEGVITSHPFYDRDSLIITGSHVTNDSGTGCVHTAPGHGADDFIVGNKYGLPAFCPVNEKGVLTEDAGVRLAGLFYEKANEEVLQILQEKEALLHHNKITHSYPHDWRTKKPIIFRATAQWFASINPIREKLLKEIDEISWFPSWGKLRMHNMIADRDDWCISRQRVWGVPIPIIYNEDNTPIIDEKVFEHIATLFAKFGSNIWFELEEKDLLPPGYTNPHSPNNIYRKETDIMDVWFDSGSSHTGVLLKNDLPYPADLYLEGSDQYRGWFNSSLIIGVAAHNKAPYKQVVSHGFIMDTNAQKFSKSLGNGIAPADVIKQYGADILRLWVGTVAYQSDIKISDELLKQVAEVYRKIRNTMRFLLGNLSDFGGKSFNYNTDKAIHLELVDNFIIEKLHLVTNNFINCFDNYDFAGGMQEVLNFMANDLSSFYLDLTKDILYCDESSSLRRRQVQTVIYETLDTLIKLLTPVLPYTMEEVYTYFKKEDGEVSSALLSIPTKYQNIDLKLLDEYKLILELRSDILKALEEARGAQLIGSAQEAYIYYQPLKEETIKVTKKLSQLEKNRLFIVSYANEGEVDGKKYDVSKVKVVKHQGIKCERCWNRYDKEEMSVKNLCPRCQSLMDKLGD